MKLLKWNSIVLRDEEVFLIADVEAPTRGGRTESYNGSPRFNTDTLGIILVGSGAPDVMREGKHRSLTGKHARTDVDKFIVEQFLKELKARGYSKPIPWDDMADVFKEIQRTPRYAHKPNPYPQFRNERVAVGPVEDAPNLDEAALRVARQGRFDGDEAASEVEILEEATAISRGR